MLDHVEPSHIAEFLSPFEHAEPSPSVMSSIAFQLGLVAGQPIMIPPEMSAQFELARQRLLDETI